MDRISQIIVRHGTFSGKRAKASDPIGSPEFGGRAFCRKRRCNFSFTMILIGHLSLSKEVRHYLAAIQTRHLQSTDAFHSAQFAAHPPNSLPGVLTHLERTPEGQEYQFAC